jgi:DNA-binding transcriptional LysR family regulator
MSVWRGALRRSICSRRLRPDRPGLNDLDAVLAVARRSSFRSAALDLEMSTTALSRAIAKLEAHLGVRLFNRTTRSVSLTEAGRAFVAQVAPGLEDWIPDLRAERRRHGQPGNESAHHRPVHSRLRER